MSKPLRVLIVEDSEDDAQLLLRELRRGDYDPTYLRVDKPEAMKNAFEKLPWDMVISDYSMPHFNGLSALALVKESGFDLPFIILSGTIGEDVAVAAMKAGAHDYIMKGNLARLIPAVERELREAEGRLARRQAEEKLRTSERLRVIGEMAASIIHDLKNPMQIIMSTAELLDNEGLLAEKRKKYRRTMDAQLQRMVGMIQEILEFARGEMSLTPSPVNLPEFCQGLAERSREFMADQAVRVTYSAEVEEGASPVMLLDIEKIWRVVTNLVGNAQEAMPQGGEIRLRLSMNHQEARLEVEDTGPGIAEQIRERLFQPFATYGKTRGTGLGLSIVKKIVEAHSGTIIFTTSQGAGTTFSITLPRQPIVRTECGPAGRASATAQKHGTEASKT